MTRPMRTRGARTSNPSQQRRIRQGERYPLPSVIFLSAFVATGLALLRAVRSAQKLGVNAFWLNVPGGGAMCPTCGKLNPRPAVWLLEHLR